jgi:16S rRNA (adenine1518-N6/adenine1519-N6)-dimethyltransferase
LLNVKYYSLKRLGQHLLYDQNIIDKIVNAAEINENDIVFEIGSGDGILTEALCKKAKYVISTEIDKNLYHKIKLNYDNLEIHNTDGLKLGLTINFTKFVANIPYSKSRDIIELLAKKEFELAVIMVQREFADKLFTNKAIGIIAQYCFDIEHIMDVSRYAFKPTPKVDSRIIRLKKKNSLNDNIINAIKLFYSFRGKKVKHASKLLALKDNSLIEKRVDDLKPEEVIRIIV